jgi:hypothetical protein
MDAHLTQHVRQGKITRQLAEQRASVPEELRRLLGDGPAAPGPGGMNGGGYSSPSAIGNRG